MPGALRGASRLPTEEVGPEPPRRHPLLALAGDERLARRARGGDGAAIEAIFRRYEQDLYRFCMGILGEPQDAQDALQNTMVKVLRALPGESREIRLKPWLYRIAHNEAVELRRGRRPLDPLGAEVVAAGAGIEELVEGDERLRKLFEDMADLPERQRAALIMRELNGLEFGEIAAALETSPGAVRQALYEARRGLNEMRSGREMVCAEVTRALSDGDGSSRRRPIRAHLRECAGCRRFAKEIDERRQTLAAIVPLPAVVAVALAKGVLGGSGGAAAGGAVGGGAAGGAVATSIGASGVLKSVAGVLAVVVLGTAAADRSGLLEIDGGQPRHQGNGQAETRAAGVAQAPASAPASKGRAQPISRRASTRHRRAERSAADAGARAADRRTAAGSRAGLDVSAALKDDPVDAAPAASTAPVGNTARPDHPAHPGHPAHPAHPPHPEKAPQGAAGKPAKEGKPAQPESGAPPKSEKGTGPAEHPAHPEHSAHPATSAKPEASTAPAASSPAPATEAAATEAPDPAEYPAPQASAAPPADSPPAATEAE